MVQRGFEIPHVRSHPIILRRLFLRDIHLPEAFVDRNAARLVKLLLSSSAPTEECERHEVAIKLVNAVIREIGAIKIAGNCSAAAGLATDFLKKVRGFRRFHAYLLDMQPLTREQILTLIHNNPVATAELIEALFAELQKLRERVQALEEQLAQNSRNSHKPPLPKRSRTRRNMGHA